MTLGINMAGFSTPLRLIRPDQGKGYSTGDTHSAPDGRWTECDVLYSGQKMDTIADHVTSCDGLQATLVRCRHHRLRGLFHHQGGAGRGGRSAARSPRNGTHPARVGRSGGITMLTLHMVVRSDDVAMAWFRHDIVQSVGFVSRYSR